MNDFPNTVRIPRVQDEARRRIRGLMHDRLTSGHSYAPGSLPMAAENARTGAAVDHLWDLLEEAGLVKVEIEMDDMTFEDYEGDMFNVEAHKDTVPGGERTIRAQEKRARKRFEEDGGTRGVVASYRTSEDGEWEVGGSCFGFEADYAETDECQRELKWEAVVELRKALKSRCPMCRKCA